MAVLRFCVCGQPLPDRPGEACPACGRSIAAAPFEPAAPKVHRYRAIEVASEFVEPRPRPAAREPTYDWAGPPTPTPRLAVVALTLPPDERSLARDESELRYLSNLLVLSLLLGVWWTLAGSVCLFLALQLPASVGLIVAGGPVFFLLGHTARCLRVVFNTAAHGERMLYPWPGFNLPRDFRHALRAALGVAAGPIVVVMIALWFWVETGFLTFFDAFILTELIAIAAGWWLLTVVMPEDRSNWTSFDPAAIARWLGQCGWRSPAMVVAVMVPVSLAIGFFLESFDWFHDHFLAGMFFRFLTCNAALLMTFLLVRGLGLSLPRSKTMREKRLVQNEDC